MDVDVREVSAEGGKMCGEVGMSKRSEMVYRGRGKW